METAELFVGVDTGGTFTDLVLLQGGEISVHKVLSTPDDPSQAILQALADLAVTEKLSALVHGSTIATNAVLEHKGVRTGLITTAGFRDVLEIGRQTKLPMIDIHTVGAGGGSLAWFDVGGALRVGPKSAGADPGPVAYGRGGTQPTVTDANVVLGRLIPNAFLGGAMSLDSEQARKALGGIAERLDTTPEEAALGIIRIVNANMEGAIRVISVERGSDPRDFILAAFGGAGPLHACELAAALQIPRVFIPRTPGVLSALGMLAADVIKDYVRTVMVQEAGEVVETAFSELEEQGRAELAREGFSASQVRVESYLDLRYVGQSYELTIPFEGDVAAAITLFHAAHKKRFGYNDPHERVQVVNVRLKARGMTTHPTLERQEEQRGAQAAATETRQVIFGGPQGAVTYETALYAREKLVPGMIIEGSAIITQYDTTTVLPPEWLARSDAFGHLIAELREKQ